MKVLIVLVILTVLVGWAAVTPAAFGQAGTRPNVVIILADDMGYSDLGVYGSEIPTPNIDRLAEQGVRFSQFYNTARCSPSRASLLTGLHPHQSGMGTLAISPRSRIRKRAAPGHQGFLNHESVTMAEVLREAGYHTYMTGKWHLGYHSQDQWPLQRGFDHYYGLIAGGASYFKPDWPRGLALGNERLPMPEGDYYTTDAFTDYAIRFVREQQDDAPFLLYLAYTAPHWPLHAREDDVEKFVGMYRKGWDALRRERHRRQLTMGLLEETWPLSPRDEGARAWADLTEEQQAQLDYRMAIYAAQIHRMDVNVGRLVDALEEEGKLDNTLILFLSDNGGSAEPYTDLGGGAFEDVNEPMKIGAISYGQGWANASNTPFRGFKVETYEGGIATPLIVHWPARLGGQQGTIVHTPGYLIDILPTILEITGARYPEQYDGNAIHPLEGKSLMPVLAGSEAELHEWMFWEHDRNRAVRHGYWKAVWDEDTGAWELYDLERDRTELHDLSVEYPERVAQMARRWERWAQRVQVYPLP